MVEKILRLTGTIPANSPAGTAVTLDIADLQVDPNVTMKQINLPAGLLKKAWVTSASSVDAVLFIVNQKGARQSLGTETTIQESTVYNPNTIKNFALAGGTYSFIAVTTRSSGSSAVPLTFFVTVEV